MRIWDTITKLLILLLFLMAMHPPWGWPAGGKSQDQPIRLYLEHCASCHGKKGEGEKASPLDSTGHAWHHPDGQTFLWIKLGRYGPAQRMPGFGNTLSDQEICDLIEMMKPWWTSTQRQSQKAASKGFTGSYPCGK